MTTLRSIKAQIAKLEKQAADLLKKEVSGVIAKIRDQIGEYGLTAADLGLTGKTTKAVKATRKRKSVANKPDGIPMYVDSASGKTWTGKGKPPNWIVEGLKKGKSKADFLISKAGAATATVKASTPTKTAMDVKAVKTPKKPASASKPAKRVTGRVTARKALPKTVTAKPEVTKG